MCHGGPVYFWYVDVIWGDLVCVFVYRTSTFVCWRFLICCVWGRWGRMAWCTWLCDCEFNVCPNSAYIFCG